jgi:ABC-type Fe3+-hydroxamate transport system substrate-binding protein
MNMPNKKQKSAPSVAVDRDPRERFTDLANKRVTSAIKQLRLIGNLANRKNYSYEAEDGRKIVRALQRELEDLKAKFKGEENDANSIFSL